MPKRRAYVKPLKTSKLTPPLSPPSPSPGPPLTLTSPPSNHLSPANSKSLSPVPTAFLKTTLFPQTTLSLYPHKATPSLYPHKTTPFLYPHKTMPSLYPTRECHLSTHTQNSAVSRPPQNNANPSHPQLRLLCSAMDAEALRRYIMDHPNDRETLRSELLDAFQVARDPAKMVLDALTGFFPSNANEDGSSELHTMRRSCVFMLEQLMLFSPEIGEDVRQRAKSLAQEWKGKVKVGDNTLKPMGFLHLLAAYGLGSDYDSTELLELLIDVVRYREVFGLCRGLNLVDKVPGMLLRSHHVLSV
ncbi:FRIGIDA-like protein 3 [Vitis vinifera]|uniref:FRIGIDA-like protein n=1 Tax=Vitis vinifera TaxID=29760 RepID=A0A438K0H5_VITVI|nr:FRIGIDA-like protein 3 [Vitis vinifera]